MMAKIVHFIKQMHILCYINVFLTVNLTFTRYLSSNYISYFLHKVFYSH